MMHPPKYPRTPHWPWSQTVHADDKLHQNPDFFVGRDVVITEKLDGGNTCLWSGEVYARSTSQPSHHDWMGMVRKHHAWKTLGKRMDLVFYGEDLFGVHSIKYDPMNEDETFRLFASLFVSDTGESGLFAPWHLVEQHAKELNLKTVPVLFSGRFRSVNDITNWFETNIQQPSQLGGECEGFVIREYTAFDENDFSNSVCKYVRANHVQTDKHWSKHWNPCDFKA